MSERYDWMKESRSSPIYKAGVDEFMKFVRDKFGRGATIRCPCRRCLNTNMHAQNVVKAHLLVDGINKWYRPWFCHGEKGSVQMEESSQPSTDERAPCQNNQLESELTSANIYKRRRSPTAVRNNQLNSQLSRTDVLKRQHSPDAFDPQALTSASDLQGRPPKIRRRGKTRAISLEKHNAATGKRLVIQIDYEEGRPLDAYQAKNLQMVCGLVARENVPLVADFRTLSRSDLQQAYNRIKSLVDIVGFDDDERIREAVDRRLAKQLKDYRYSLKKAWEEKGDAARPDNVPVDQWNHMVSIWKEADHQDKCRKNKDTRLTQVNNLHASGSKSFAVRRHEISQKELKGEPCGEMLLFLKTHFKEDKYGEAPLDPVTRLHGRWTNTYAAATYVKMLQIRDEAEANGKPLTEAEICNIVLKNDSRSDAHNGRGHGFVPPERGRHRGGISKTDLEQALQRVRQEIRAQVREEVRAELRQEMGTFIQEEVNVQISAWFRKFAASGGPPFIPTFSDSSQGPSSSVRSQDGVDTDSETDDDDL